MNIKFELKKGMQFIVSTEENLDNWHRDMDKYKGTALTVRVIQHDRWSDNVQINAEGVDRFSFNSREAHIDWIATLELNNVKFEKPNGEMIDRVTGVLVKNGFDEIFAKSLLNMEVNYDCTKMEVII